MWLFYSSNALLLLVLATLIGLFSANGFLYYYWNRDPAEKFRRYFTTLFWLMPTLCLVAIVMYGTLNANINGMLQCTVNTVAGPVRYFFPHFAIRDAVSFALTGVSFPLICNCNLLSPSERPENKTETVCV